MRQAIDISSTETQIRGGKWSEEEHNLFIEGLRLYDKNWKLIQKIVTTRNGAQIRSHAQKYFNKLDRHREVAWNPDNSQDSKDNQGSDILFSSLQAKPNRIRQDFYLFDFGANLGHLRLRPKQFNTADSLKNSHSSRNPEHTPRKIPLSSYPQYLSHEESNSPMSESQTSNPSYWATHIQPFLTDPYYMNHFLRVTTAIDFNCPFREINNSQKKRRDSFQSAGILEDQTTIDRNIEGHF